MLHRSTLLLSTLAAIYLAGILALAGGKGEGEEDLILYRGNIVMRGGGKGGKGKGSGNFVLADQQQDPFEELAHHHHNGHGFGHEHGTNFGNHHRNDVSSHGPHESYEQKLIRDIVMGHEQATAAGRSSARQSRRSSARESNNTNNNSDSRRGNGMSWAQLLLGSR